MNRLKLWVFTIVSAAVAFLALRSATESRRAEAVAALDARLAGAAAYVSTSFRALGREAGATAAAVARDPALLAALRGPEAVPPPPPPAAAKGKKPAPPPPPAPARDRAAEEGKVRAAAAAALAAAEKGLGFDLPAGSTATAASRDALAHRPEAGEGEAAALLRAAAGGTPRRGWVRQDQKLLWATALPAGDLGGVLVLVPLDDAWAKAATTAAGAEVTLSSPEVKSVSTARPADIGALTVATRAAGAVDVGAPLPVEVSLGPVRLPRLPQPVAGGAPLRARAVALEGLKGGFAIVSVSAFAASHGPGTAFYEGVLLLLLFVLCGLVLGLFVKSREPAPQVPEELLAAAARIEKGDFAARAPALAGKLGTVAAALNRAAELAGPAAALRGAPDAPATTDEWYRAASAAGAVKATMAGVPVVTATTAGLPAQGAASASPRGATGLVPAAPASAGAPGPEVDEEAHWQAVYQDFLRTRGACGESTDGLTYEKFKTKLEGNKATLVTKYACKTVRFQVYVKDGKAALKATPVK